MSIFDVLTNGTLGSVLDTLSNGAKNAARDISANTPGGVGGLAGAGVLGALLGNVLQGDLMKSATLAGAGAVAWNFYKKWAESRQKQTADVATGQALSGDAAPSGWSNVASAPHAAASAPIDPTAMLVMRAMVYAARADGTIDATERDRIDQILHNLLPGQNVTAELKELQTETIDPAKIAKAVKNHEQAEDVYRLSCSVIDPDQFMEVSYLDALAKALGIDASQKSQLEAEADQAKKALRASLPA